MTWGGRSRLERYRYEFRSAEAAEKSRRSIVFAAHRNPPFKGIRPNAHNHTPTASQNNFFSNLLEVFRAISTADYGSFVARS
jgi:hypothetical protein